MSVKEARARIQARVWRDIAQGDLDLSALPRPTLEKLVDMVCDATLLAVDEELSSSMQQQVTPQAADLPLDQEEILWEGRPLLSISVRYVITSERVRIIEGIIGKTREDIELVKIRDMSQSQTAPERMLNVGDITVRSNDVSHPEVVLNNIRDPQAVHEILRRAVLKARQRHGLVYRELM
jgi:hypothetical protein